VPDSHHMLRAHNDRPTWHVIAGAGAGPASHATPRPPLRCTDDTAPLPSTSHKSTAPPLLLMTYQLMSCPRATFLSTLWVRPPVRRPYYSTENRKKPASVLFWLPSSCCSSRCIYGRHANAWHQSPKWSSVPHLAKDSFIEQELPDKCRPEWPMASPGRWQTSTGRWDAWPACSRSSTAAGFSPVDDVAAALEPGTNRLQVLLALVALLAFYFRLSEWICSRNKSALFQVKETCTIRGQVELYNT
jgi:hypothetical protein